MRISHSRLAVVAVAGAAVVGGCGADAERAAIDGRAEPISQDERLATQRVQDFLSAMEAKDDARACTMMTPKLRHTISTTLRMQSEAGTCRTRAADIYSPAKAPGNADATVKTIQVVQSSATATVTARPTSDVATGPVESNVVLERRGNRWLIANF